MKDTLYNEAPKFPIGVKYGLIVAAINIIWNLLTYIMGVGLDPGFFNSLLSTGVTVISILIFFQGVKSLKKLQNGYLSFTDGFVTGAIITVVASIVYGIFYYIYLKWINPEIFQTVKDIGMESMTEEQREQVGQVMDTIMTAGMVSLTTIMFYLIAGCILSLIIAAILRNKAPKPIA